jgi:hypothetical protein
MVADEIILEAGADKTVQVIVLLKWRYFVGMGIG